MSDQRPPGGLDGPTQDPDGTQPKPGAGTPGSGSDASQTSPPSGSRQSWVDPDRTQAYSPRGSIADRLKGRTGESGPSSDTQLPDQVAADATRRRPKRQPLVGTPREGRGLRLVALLGGVIVAGLVAGAAAAWVTGWRPGFLATKGAAPDGPAANTPPGQTPGRTPGETTPPADPKPGEPPKTPPAAGEIARSCFAGPTDVKQGAAACGFALDAAGVVTFKGEKIAERLLAGSGPAQRLVLYPFAPSGRYVFLRACEAASGGRCTVQRLADTKERKLFDVRGGADGFMWVAWSPKEQVGLLGYRDGVGETIAAIATADGRALKPSLIRSPKNRYALVKQSSLRWTNEESISVEVKLCPFARGKARNKECEDDSDIRYRRRTVKLGQ